MTTAPVLPSLLGAFVVTLLVHGYLWHRLGRARRVAPVLGVLALLLPTTMLGLLYMRVLPLAIARPVMRVSFTYIGFLFFALLLAALCEPLRLAQRVRVAVIVGGAIALGGYACLHALSPVRVHEQKFPDLPFSGYRVAQLSDLHIGAMRGRAFVDDIVDRVNATHPDLVVITGDLVDGTPAQLLGELEPLRRFVAKDGVYLVLGNHEHLSLASPWRRALPSLGIHVLVDERVHLPRFDLVGLDDEPHDTSTILRDRAPTIVLAHEPERVKEASRAGALLQLSGHTHGGQIAPLQLLEWLTQGYVAGRYDVGATCLFVSPGTGFWGPPMRLGTEAEISLLVLGAR